MRQTELTQTEGGLWVLPGVGTLRRTGRVSRAATAEAGGRRWQIVRYGIVRTGFTATDESGAPAGELRNPLMKRSETLRWMGRVLALRYEDAHYALIDGGRSLARMAPTAAGKRPLDVALEDEAADPGLLLFAAFIVQAYADDASFPQRPSPPTR